MTRPICTRCFNPARSYGNGNYGKLCDKCADAKCVKARAAYQRRKFRAAATGVPVSAMRVLPRYIDGCGQCWKNKPPGFSYKAIVITFPTPGLNCAKVKKLIKDAEDDEMEADFYNKLDDLKPPL